MTRTLLIQLGAILVGAILVGWRPWQRHVDWPAAAVIANPMPPTEAELHAGGNEWVSS